MDGKELLVSKQVEYVLVKPRRKRPPFEFALVLIVLLATGVALFAMRFQDSAPQLYPVLSLPAIGLNAYLKTKWVGNSGNYLFRVKPSSGNETRFDEVLRKVPRDQIHFHVVLLDQDGFEVCTDDPKMTRTEGKTLTYVGMGADARFTNCSEAKMRSASLWKVTYSFPELTKDLNAVPGAEKAPLKMASQITGADGFTGDIETVDKGSFRVTRHAEQKTLFYWDSMDPVTISCRPEGCLLTNVRTAQSVHVKQK